MSVAERSLTIPQGNSVWRIFRVYEITGNVRGEIALAGKRIDVYVKKTPAIEDGLAMAYYSSSTPTQVTISTQPGNEFRVFFELAATAYAGTYFWRADLIDGVQRRTLVKGDFVVTDV